MSKNSYQENLNREIEFERWFFLEDENFNDPSKYCSYCGKEFEDFSDLGCEYCDRRHPDFGELP